MRRVDDLLAQIDAHLWELDDELIDAALAAGPTSDDYDSGGGDDFQLECAWCSHAWHGLPCEPEWDGCDCDSSRDRLDDTWRPVLGRDWPVLERMREEGLDGWAAQATIRRRTQVPRHPAGVIPSGALTARSMFVAPLARPDPPQRATFSWNGERWVPAEHRVYGYLVQPGETVETIRETADVHAGGITIRSDVTSVEYRLHRSDGSVYRIHRDGSLELIESAAAVWSSECDPDSAHPLTSACINDQRWTAVGHTDRVHFARGGLIE